MINHFKAEFYKLRHSKILITILGVCAAVIMVSFALGDMTFFGAGDGTESVIGFQAKCYLSSEIPTFQTVARSSLAYTAFFWIIGILFATIFFTKEYNTGTIKLSVAYGTKRTILYYTKAITILVVSLITYLIFVATFFVIEIINQIVSKDNIYLGEIQKKENELKENISCLSHDLRTPLTSIRGYLQLLSSAPDEKRAEYISALSGKALRLERLIDDFYQISLLEAGQYPFYYEKVELCSLLTEILLDNYSIFSVNGIEPQIEIPNMDIYLNADRKACIRIIQNLIFNAVTSTTNNVVIQLINIADSVQLCIKNPVASIPTEEYSKLLERFYVADVSRSNGTSGQGLYIVKKLLLMMNCTNPIIEIHDHNFMITIDFSPLLIKK